jgi:hypothetical protein
MLLYMSPHTTLWGKEAAAAEEEEEPMKHLYARATSAY